MVNIERAVRANSEWQTGRAGTDIKLMQTKSSSILTSWTMLSSSCGRALSDWSPTAHGARLLTKRPALHTSISLASHLVLKRATDRPACACALPIRGLLNPLQGPASGKPYFTTLFISILIESLRVRRTKVPHLIRCVTAHTALTPPTWKEPGLRSTWQQSCIT